jgi:putative peptidoglycan lipid II flippase
MQQDDLWATLLTILGLAGASLTGLARQAALAHQLGAGRAADIYLVAFALPEFAFVALPIVLAPAFLPLFARRRIEQGESSAWRFGLRTAALIFVTLSGLSALAGLSAPLYVNLLAPGLASAEQHQVIQLIRRMLPAVAIQGLVTLAGATLQVYRRFARPALATAIYNVTFVAALLFLPLSWGAGRAAWGVLLGSGVALLLQATLLVNYRPSRARDTSASRPRRESVGQDIRHLAHSASWMAAGYAVHHAILLIDRAMATTLGAGRTAALQFAYHLALVVGQASGLAVSTALFPRLAEQTANGDTSGVRAALSDALRFVLLIGLPTTCALVLLRAPIVTLLLQRGAFDAVAAETVSRPLAWYAIAVLADALCQPIWRVVYAQRHPQTILAINGVQTTIRLVCNLALVPAFGYNGLALSAAIGLSLQAGLLGWWAWRRIGAYLAHTWWKDVARIGLATAVAAMVVGASAYLLSGAPAIVRLSVGGTLGGLAYWLALTALGLQVIPRASSIPLHSE